MDFDIVCGGCLRMDYPYHETNSNKEECMNYAIILVLEWYIAIGMKTGSI